MIKVRPGIVLTKVCDENILVACYEARQYCPYTTILNDTGAVIWEGISDNQTIAEIIEKLEEAFDIPSGTDVEGTVHECLDMLHSHGYFLIMGYLENSLVVSFRLCQYTFTIKCYHHPNMAVVQLRDYFF